MALTLKGEVGAERTQLKAQMNLSGLDRYSTLGNIPGPSGLTIQRAYDRLRSEEVALCQVRGTIHLSPVDATGFGQLVDLDHPSLTKVHDFILTDEAAFYSREIGLTSTLGDLPADRIDQSCIYLCLMGGAEALAALHDAGLTHGLVLAEHMQIALRGNEFAGTRLTDANLRKLLSPASLKVRERWDAPEVKAGAEVSPASDVYQLGSTLLGALSRSGPSSGAKRQSRLSYLRYRGVDKDLLAILDQCVAPDPKKRFADGGEVLRALKAADWAMPARSKSVKSLITDQLVGRESELGQFTAVLDQGPSAGVRWIEFLGAPGMGRSRILEECGAQGKAGGWNVIRIGSPGDQDPMEALVRSVRRTLDVADERASTRSQRETMDMASRPRSAGSDDENGRWLKGVVEIVALVEDERARLLFLVDNADLIEAGTIRALRILASEAKAAPIIFVSSGERSARVAEAKQIKLGPFASRDMKRYLEPLLLSSLNPEETCNAVEKSSGGNPLWVQLLLASWLDSGRLRLVNGRPFWDEKVDSPVPPTIRETISNLYQRISREERELIEAMAIWDGPLPLRVAERVLTTSRVPSDIVNSTEGGYFFIGDTIGPAIRALMSQDRIRGWSAKFLAITGEAKISAGQQALLLLQAGRSGEGVRKLVECGQKAIQLGNFEAAYRHLRAALTHYPVEGLAGLDRTRLAFDAARVATQVGERRWAREVLESRSPADDADPEFQLEWVLLYANVLRDLRHTKEAAGAYAQVQELITRHPDLQHRSMEVQLEEANNDSIGGDLSKAFNALERIVKALERTGPSPLLAIAVQRLATTSARLGQTQKAVLLDLRAVRLARNLGDPHLAARSHINLGQYYRLLNRPRRALLALNRAKAALRRHPNDGLAASEALNRAEMLMVFGRMGEAEEHLLRAKALRERSGEVSRVPTILSDLGYYYRHTGRLRTAARYYQEAIALAEEFDLPIALVGQSNLGEVFLHLGEYEAAEHHLSVALSESRPSYLGITLINLGRLRRQQKRYPEALQLFTKAEELLKDSAPKFQPQAIIDLARVLIDAGDIHGASFQLSRVRDEFDQDEEQAAHYQLVAGLIRKERGEAPHESFDSAVNRARGSDPTLRAEILVSVLDSAMQLNESDEAWIKGHLRSLEAAAAKTDAEPVAIGARILRGAFAERFATAGGDQGLTASLQRTLDQPGSPIEGALGELMQQLPGAAGAAVFVVGIGSDGKPMLSATPKASEAREDRVRPYRLAVREFDKKLFKAALEAAGGNVYEAARQLRLPTSTFRYRAMKLGLLKPTTRDS